MKAILRFIKATLVGGVLFVVPLVVIAMLAREAFRFCAEILRPIARLFPAETFAGVLVVDLLAVAALVGVCFLAGLVISTRPGRALSNRIERLVLKRVPGFTFLKSMTYGITGLEADGEVSTALIRFDDAWVLGFVVERHASGLVTVFVPSAPTPAVGSIYFVNADQIQVLDASMIAAVKSIMSLGVGSRELLEGAATRRPTASS